MGEPSQRTRSKRQRGKSIVRSNIEEVQETEKSLRKLLEDARTGKLRAFRNEKVFEEIDAIRQQQEELVQQHLDLTRSHLRNSRQPSSDGSDNRLEFDSLTSKLDELCASVQLFHSRDSASDNH
ncbi:coiled-coil domain-containing protein 28A-like isoform X2 [Oscarella lobularis]|uniref:coiled-coil domain-containing protein 28A-like isoform X2 n=1 Tax=Oscarella lobularis TaxID=121494 RepID=UPI003313409E